MASFFGNLRRLLGKKERRLSAKPLKARPTIEQLEERCVMDGGMGNQAPTISLIADQIVPRASNLLAIQVNAQDADGDPLSYGAAIGDQLAALDQYFQFQKNGSYYDNFRGAGEKYIFSSAQGKWFFLLPNGELHRFNATLNESPLVANVGSNVWANPALLHDPLVTIPQGLVSGDAAAYALDQQLGLQSPGTYYQNLRGANEKYIYAANLGRWHVMMPTGQLHAWNGSLATSPLVASFDTRYYDNPALLHEAEPPVNEAAATFINSAGALLVDTPPGYSGTFVVTVLVSDGKAATTRSFRVTAPNAAPNLPNFTNQNLPPGGDTSITLPTRDQDGDLINYRIVLGGNDAAASLDQQLGLTKRDSYYENLRGVGEKYIFGTVRNGWYYILPTGALHQWGGSLSTSPQVALLDPSYSANPAKLHEAAASATYPASAAGQLIAASLNNGILSINTPTGYVGTFSVSVTAWDGLTTTTRTFSVSAANNAPVLNPISAQTLAGGSPLQINLGAWDPDGDRLTLSVAVTGESQAYSLDQQLQLRFNGSYYANFRGLGEKYIYSDAQAKWYFILPTGALYAWGGSVAGSTLVATLSPMYSQSPALLHDAPLPGPVGVTGQINGDILTLTPSPGFIGTFQATVTADDGMNQTKRTFTGRVLGPLTVEVNNPLQLADPLWGKISSSLLRASSAGSTPADVIYSVVTGPSQGTLLLNNTILVAGSTFTQDDVNNNRVTYFHNGSDTSGDAFTFSARTSLGAVSATTQFRVIKVAGTQVNTQGEVLAGMTGSPLADLAQALQGPSGQILAGLIDLSKSQVLLSGSPNLVKVGLLAGANPRLAMQMLQQLATVQWVAPNLVYTGPISEFTPNDPRFPEQIPYHHDTMSNRQAWDITTGTSAGGVRTIVAVLDNGVPVNRILVDATPGAAPYQGHPDLNANIWTNLDEQSPELTPDDDDFNGFNDDRHGWDFVGNDNDPSPPSVTPFFGHGTHVAGIIAAAINNGQGVTGVAGSALVMPVRYINTQNDGTSQFTSLNFFLAHRYAVDNGARIIVNSNNMDLDNFTTDPLVVAAMNYVYGAGVLHINAAGNNNQQNPTRQAFTQTLLVANTETNDSKAVSSNFGTGIDFSAPGQNILSTLPPNTYGLLSGTSMAAANAAGTAALIWARNPLWTRDQVAAQLIATTDRITTDPLGLQATQPLFLGSGRVNSNNALVGARRVARLDTQIFAQLPRPAIGFGLPIYPESYADVPSIATGITSFSLKVDGVLDPATVKIFNFSLVRAGADNTFDTTDDIVSTPNPPTAAQPLRLSFGPGFVYRVGTNLIPFTVAGMTAGRYRLRITSGGAAGLRDPFGTPLYGVAGNTDFFFNVGVVGGGGTVTGTRTSAENPRNETDNTATDLGVLTTNLTTLQAIFRHPDGIFDHDWFSVVPSRAGRLTIDLTNIVSAGDIHVRAYNVVNNVLQELGSSQRVGRSRTQQTSFNVNAGERIFIWVYGFNFAQGDYDMTLTLV